MADPIILPVPLERPVYEALFQLAEMMNCSAEDLASEAIAAAITLPGQLDLEALGTALLTFLEGPHAPMDTIHVTEEHVAELKRFLLPASAAQLLLGDDLINRLTGLSQGAPPTAEANMRLEAVATVCEVLKSSLSEAGVRRWWINPRYKLRGKSPADFLRWSWTPDELAFRLVVELAESDAGFAAT